MKNLFLASQISVVAGKIAAQIDRAKHKRLVFINTAAENEERIGMKAVLFVDYDGLVRDLIKNDVAVWRI